MLFDMIAALFRRKKPAADQPRQELAWRVDRAAPRQPFPEGKLACVFRGATLISTSSDAVPARVGEGETCWLLPAADVGMLIDVEIGAEVVSSLVEVRFEVDGLLGELLRKRDALRQEDVAALVSSELGGTAGSAGPRLGQRADRCRRGQPRTAAGQAQPVAAKQGFPLYGPGHFSCAAARGGGHGGVARGRGAGSKERGARNRLEARRGTRLRVNGD